MTDPYCESIDQTIAPEAMHGTRPNKKQRTTDRLRLHALILLMCVCFAGSPIGHFPLAAGAERADTARDGQHDFDFNIGVWHTHIRRVLDPLSGSTSSIELNGTVTVRKVWDGRAQLEEIETDGPKGHWEGLSLFLYNPAAHQWSQSFINSQIAELGTPLIGEFHDGRGELFGQDTFQEKRSSCEACGRRSSRIHTATRNRIRTMAGTPGSSHSSPT